MNYIIMLAGGIGSRFWPLSTQELPKQFIALCSNKPLLAESVIRIRPLVKQKNIFIATNRKYKGLALSCLNKFAIPKGNFFFEREGRNTFAPIAALTNIILNKDKDAVIAVFPSDHFIKDKGKFLTALKQAFLTAKTGSIVTLGIVPKHPETGFGYIKINSKCGTKKAEVFKVEKFIEKPDLVSAKKLIKDARYYWNGGIFVFKARTLLEEVKRLEPKAFNILSEIKTQKQADRLWSKLPFTSIDYAIMEHSNKISLIPLDCGWSDLGSWQAITEVKMKDKNGNIFMGKVINLESKNTLVLSKRLVATVGLKDLIIVDTKDALLVCAKDKSQQVKKIVEILNKNELKR